MPFASARSFFLYTLAFCATFPLFAAAPVTDPVKGAIIMDAATGAVIFQEDADIVSPPASVTKLMTFLIVSDRIAAGAITLDTPVPITAEDAKTGGTQVWLDPRETFTIEELLYALMIQSANDAASALARAAAGSREAFVALMNERSRGLGMTNTIWRSPHGLPPSDRKLANSDVTSPRDLAILSRELLLKTDVLKYTATKERPFGAGKRAEPVIMRNHNKLLGRVAGVDGLKTGFTNAAGFCLSATAQRGDKRIIVAVMGSPSAKVRDVYVASLIEKGFPLIPATSVFHGYTPSPIASSAPAGAATSPITSSAAPAAPAASAPATEDGPMVKFTLPPVKKK
jgi:D-alanyl-D-alanine carboxypeptidase